MTKSQVVALLAFITAYDRRTTSEIDDEAWYLAVGDLDFEDAKTAVAEHFRRSKDWLMPVHVRDGVATIRTRRADCNGAPAGAGYSKELPDAEPDDVAAYVAAVREQRFRFGDELKPRPVAALISGRPFQSVPAVSAAEVRREIRAIEGGAR